MEQQNNMPNEEQKTISVNKHPEWGNQPLIDEISLPEKLKHLSKQPPANPCQNLHTTTQVDPESTNTDC